jgi:hypothetical protein
MSACLSSALCGGKWRVLCPGCFAIPVLSPHIFESIQVYVLLQYDRHGAAPANTRSFAVRGPFKLSNFKEMSLIYLH